MDLHEDRNARRRDGRPKKVARDKSKGSVTHVAGPRCQGSCHADLPSRLLRPSRGRCGCLNGLTVALEIGGDDRLRSPVGEPQTVVVPARRLAERENGHRHLCQARGCGACE